MRERAKLVSVVVATVAIAGCNAEKKTDKPPADTIQAPATEAATKTVETETTTTTTESLTEEGEKELVEASQRALEFVRTARKAIAAKDKAAAKEATISAGMELAKARALVPEIHVRDQIWSTRNQLVFEVDEVIPQDLVRLEEEIDVQEDFSAAQKESAKKRVKNAKGHAKKKNAKEAKGELEVLDVTVGRTSVFLPILPASQHLYAAVAKLFYADLDDVDVELKAVEDNLVVVRDEFIDFPVTQLSRHLAEAKKAHKKGDAKKRNQHLEAAQGLIAKLTTGEHKLEGFLNKEATAISAAIAKLKAEGDKAKADAMMTRLERQGFGLVGIWTRMSTLEESKVLERTLVEAHGQTELAAFEYTLMGDKTASQQKLDTAIAALTRAKDLDTANTTVDVGALLKAANDAKSAIGAGETEKAEIALAALNAKLFAMIHSLEPTKRERKK